jgi:hypothetical protein
MKVNPVLLMMTYRAGTWALSVTLAAYVAVACARSTGPEPSGPTVRLRTDSASYYLNSTFGRRVDVHIDNPSTDTIVLAKCNGSVVLGMEWGREGRWDSGGEEYFCQSNSIQGERLPPGATVQTTHTFMTLGVYRFKAALYLPGRAVPRASSCCFANGRSEAVEIR